jgi:hypothetical protein
MNSEPVDHCLARRVLTTNPTAATTATTQLAMMRPFHRDPDRQVDQKDPTPAQRSEHAADDRTDRPRGGAAHRPQPHAALDPCWRHGGQDKPEA